MQGNNGDNTDGWVWTGDHIGDSSGADISIQEMLRGQPLVPYTPAERDLSVVVRHEAEQLLLGERDNLILLKLYPQEDESAGVVVEWADFTSSTIRRVVAERIASDALNFFRPLRSGVTTQQIADGIIVQQRPFSTAFPHIILERDDFYDAATREPVLGAWRACRIQNQRRETRTNRMIDMALLALEISKSLFPLLLG